jgi:hypothetical protein
MVSTTRDEKVAAYLEDTGLQGYGFYWRLLEIVAESMSPGDDTCAVTYSLPTWSRLLYCHHHQVGKYLGKLRGNGLVTMQKRGSDIRVTIPNLAKYRDEYSQKSRHAPDTHRTISASESESEKERKEILRSGSSEQERSQGRNAVGRVTREEDLAPHLREVEEFVPLGSTIREIVRRLH